MRKLSLLFALLTAASLGAATRRAVKLTVTPPDAFLFGKGAQQTLVAVVDYSDDNQEDVTASTRFQSQEPSVATVDASGRVSAEANGVAKIRARYKGLAATATILIQRADGPRALSFAGDILPIITKIGCNGGSCHGAFHGQNGFKLSLFGYDPDADYDMIVHQHDGRRVNLKEPEKSLLLLKPSFQIPHGGGEVLPKGSPEYNTLLRWLSAGAKRDAASERRMVALRVLPPSLVLYGPSAKRQLLVTARYSDDTEADVTNQVKYQSNDDNLVSVGRDGILTAVRGGETAIFVRGPGVVGVAKVGVVLDKRPFPKVESFNFIDDYVFARLKSLNIPPSELCDDATFLRRVYLDTIGLLPTADEARRFLTDQDSRKGEKLVAALLDRPEYAEFWSQYWGDRLLNSKELLYQYGPQNFTRWLYQAFRTNMPYDQFVRALLTASGDMYDFSRPTSYYPLIKTPEEMAATTSQLFLGVRIECARCHNHPFERWTRDDFRGMAAFFSQVKHKDSGPRGNEYILFLDFSRQFQDPETKQSYWPKALGGPYFEPGQGVDRRGLLAAWLTGKENPFFARTIVNRLWAAFMGRGLVESIDDFRVTNPPTNEPLLDALARDFVAHRYDLHHLIKLITGSRAYQLSSRVSGDNGEDRMAYSHYFARHLSAEVLVDAVSQASGVPENFESFYPGTRSMQLSYPEVDSYFLDVFGRSPRKEVCERKFRPTLNQVVHRISGEPVSRKVSAKNNVVGEMLAANRPAGEIVEALYLRTLSRFPNADEKGRAQEIVEKDGDERRGLEDLLWALLNSKEFLYNH